MQLIARRKCRLSAHRRASGARASDARAGLTGRVCRIRLFAFAAGSFGVLETWLAVKKKESLEPRAWLRPKGEEALAPIYPPYRKARR